MQFPPTTAQVAHAERVYGTAAALRMTADATIFAQYRRPAGGPPSSYHALNQFLGRDETVGLEDFLGDKKHGEIKGLPVMDKHQLNDDLPLI